MKDEDKDVFARAAAQMYKAFPPSVYTFTQDKADMERLYPEGADGESVMPAQAISISEPLCKAYVNLFSNDFSADEIRKNTADKPFVERASFELILRRFVDGLANSRLELVGTTDDLAGWLATYLEAYFEPGPGNGEVGFLFSNWESLTLWEQQEVKADSIRLTPILRRPWPNIWKDN